MYIKTDKKETYSRYRLGDLIIEGKSIGEVWTHTVFIEIDEDNHISLSKTDLKEMIAFMEDNPSGREI